MATKIEELVHLSVGEVQQLQSTVEEKRESLSQENKIKLAAN